VTKHEGKPAKAAKRVPVSLRAVIQRINRRLGSEEKVLKIARSERVKDAVGWYYVLDVNRNWVISRWVNVEQYARDLGVLKEWERMEQEEEG
jgi:hypothetical protein